MSFMRRGITLLFAACAMTGLVAAAPATATAQNPDLVLNVTNSPDPVPATGIETYTIVVTNNSLTAATGNSYTMTVPATASYAGFTAGGGASCSGMTVGQAGPGTVTCSFPDLAFSATVTWTVKLRLNSAGTTNITQSVSSALVDATPADNTVITPTTVTNGADLVATLAGAATAAAGSTYSYTLSVKNQGPDPATYVRVQLPIPTGFAQQGSLPAGCSSAAGTITCDIAGSIASGATTVVGTISGKIIAASSSTVTATMSVLLQPSAPALTPQDPDNSNNTSIVSTSVTAGSDIYITKTRSVAAPYFVGGAFNFVLNPQYDGDPPASLTVTDVVPGNYTVGAVAASQNGWTCGVVGQTVTCTKPAGGVAGLAQSLGTITIPVTVNSAGASVTNTVTIAAVSPTDVNPANNTATDGAVALLTPSADLSLSKTGPNPALAVIGVPFNYTVAVSNNGPSVFYGQVVVTDNLPNGLTLNSFTGAGWSCSALPALGPAAVTCTRTYTSGAPLASGTSTPALIFNTTSSIAGPINNTASLSTVGGNVGDPNSGNDGASFQITSSNNPASADVSVIKTVDLATVAAGDVLTYTLEVVNAGPSTATNITLTDTFGTLISSGVGATGEGYIGETTTLGLASGVTCTNAVSGSNGRSLSCTIPSLPVCVQGSTCPTVVVQIRPGGDGGSRTNTANVISGTIADPNLVNNAGSVTSTVSARADVTVTNTGTPNPVNAGQDLTYVVTALNNGPSKGDNVTISNDLPLGVLFVSATPSSGSCAATPTALSYTIVGNRTITCNLGSINNGAQSTVTIVVRPGTSTRGTTLVNNVSVATSTTEPTVPGATNNTASVNTPVNVPSLDIQIKNIDTVDPVTVGNNTVYTLTVTNNGPSEANNLVITDNTPVAGLGFVSASITSPAGTTSSCPTQPAANAVGGTVICNVSRLAAGAQAVVSVTMAGTVKGIYTNNASVASDETTPTNWDFNTANNSMAQNTTVRTRADVQVVSVTPSAASIAVRRPYTWTVRIRNNVGVGYAEADTVKVTDNLPATMELTGTPTLAVVSGTMTGVTGCTGAAASTAFTCQLGTLSSGGVVDITVPVRNLTVPAASTATDAASVTTSSQDMDPSNNSNNGSTTITSSSIAGLVFRDFNNNGASDAGDTGMSGITMSLSGTAFDATAWTASATTSASGTFTIANLPEGTYAVQRGTVAEGFLTVGTQTAGTSAGTATTPPNITGIVLGEAVSATGYNYAFVPQARIGFAERTFGAQTDNVDGTITQVLRVIVKNFSLETLNTITMSNPINGAAPGIGTYVAGGGAAALNQSEYTIQAAPSIAGSCATGTPNAAYDGSGTTQLATLTSLAAGASCEFEFTVRYKPSVPLPGGGYNVQTTGGGTGALSAQTPTDLSQNGSTADVGGDNNPTAHNVVTPLGAVLAADVTTSVTFPATVNAGQTVNGTVLYTNNGPYTANGMAYTLTLSTGLSGVTFGNLPVGATATYNSGTGVVTFTGMPATLTVGQIASGDGTTGITVSYTQNATASSTITSGISTTNNEGLNTGPNSANATVGGQLIADVTTTVTLPGTADAGTTVNGTVVFKNNGPSVASGLTYTLTLSTGLTGVSFGNLPAGATATYNSGTGVVTFTGMPATRASGAVASGNGTTGITVQYTQNGIANSAMSSTIGTTTNQGANVAPDNATTSVTGQLIADVTTSLTFPATVNAGFTVNGTVTFKNNGPSVASGMTYSLTLTAGLTGVTFGNLPAGATATYNSGTGVVTFTGMPATLASGAFASGDGTSGITVSYTQNATATSAVSSTIGTTTNQGANAAPDNATVNIGGVLVADVGTTVSFPAAVNAGQTVNGTVTFTNSGPSTGSGMTYALTLSTGLSGVTFGNLPVGATAVYNSGTGVVTFTGMPATLTVGQIASGNGTTGITVSYTQNATANSTVSATITTSTNEGANTVVNTGSATILGALIADVTTAITLPATADAGTTVNATVAFKNNGPSVASGMTYTLTLSTGLTGVTFGNLPGGATATYNAGTGVVTFTGMPATLASGAFASGNGTSAITLAYTQNAVANSTVSSTIGTSTNQGANVAPDNATASVTGQLIADVTTALSFPVSVNAGQTVSGTILYKNTGPSVASGMTYTLTLSTSLGGVVFGNLPAGVTATYNATTGVVTFTGMPATLNANQIVSGDGTTPITLSYTQNAIALTNIASTIGTSTNQGANVNLDAANASPGGGLIADVRAQVSFPALVNSGVTVNGTVTYSNTGPSIASGVAYTLTMSAGLANVSFGNLPAGATAVYNAGTGVVTFTGMPATVAIGAIVSGNGTSGITISYTQNAIANSTVTGVISTTTNEGANIAPNTATAVIGGAMIADVTTTLTFTAPLVAPGTPVTGKLTYSNAGPSVATGMTYAVTLAGGLAGVTFGNLPAGATFTYNASTGAVTFAGMPATIASGVSISGDGTTPITISYLQASSGPTTVTSTVGTATNQGANVLTDNASATIGLLGADVTTSLAFPTSVNAGAKVTGTVLFQNTGPTPGTGMRYAMTFPAGLSGITFGNLPAGASATYNATTGAVSFAGMPRTLAVGAIASGDGTNPITIAFTQPASANSTVASVIGTDSNEGPDTFPDFANVTIVGQRVADVTTTLAFPATANAGQTVSGTVVFTNLGPSSALGVTYSLVLSPGLTGVTLGNLPARATYFYNSASGEVLLYGAGPATLDAGMIASGDGVNGISLSYVQNGAANTTIASTIGTTTNQGANVAPDAATWRVTGALIADLSVEKTASLAQVQPGDTVTFRIRVTNKGSVALPAGSSLVDAPSTGLTLLSASCSTLAGNSCVTPPSGAQLLAGAALPALPIGAVYEILVRGVVPTTEGAAVANEAVVSTPTGFVDGNPGDNKSKVGPTVVTSNIDLAMAKTAVGSFVPGGTGSWLLTVSNVGRGATTAPITITDVLPAGTTFQSATGAGWTCSANAQTLTCTNPGPLAPTKSTAVTVTAGISPQLAGTIVNTAVVSTVGDANLDNNSGSVTVTTVKLPDLATTKTVSTDTLRLGGGATYTITVKNVGAGPTTTAITTTDAFPTGLVPLTATGDGFTCTITGQNVSCARTTALNAGESALISIAAAVSPTASSAIFTNTACTKTAGDAVTTNDCGSVSTPMAGKFDAVLRKETVGDFISGTAGVFQLWVKNTGTVPLAGPISVTDSLPTGLTFSAVNAKAWSCVATGNIVRCTNAAPLPVGDSIPIGIVTGIAKDANTPVTNCAIMKVATIPVLGAAATACTTAHPHPDFRLVLDLSTPKYERELGDSPDFTVFVRNVGKSPLTSVVLTNQLPNGFTYVVSTSKRGGDPDRATSSAAAAASTAAASAAVRSSSIRAQTVQNPFGSPTEASQNLTAIPDPSGGIGPRVSWPLGDMNPGDVVRVDYKAAIRAGATYNADNITVASAVAKGEGLTVTSNAATVPIKLDRGVFDNHGVIAGKVYVDCDCAGKHGQGAGDVGIPGVRVMLEDGTGAITDVEGKYNFTFVRAGLHVVRVDRSTLPKGASLVAINTRNAGDGESRFVDLKVGELHRADFAEGSRSAAVLEDVLTRRRAGEARAAADTARLGAALAAPLSLAPSTVGPAGAAGLALSAPLASTYVPLALPSVLHDGNSNLPPTPARAATQAPGASTTSVTRDSSAAPTVGGVAADGTAPIRFTPAPHPFMANGLVQGRIDLRKLSRGGLDLTNAPDAFEDPMRDIGSVSDSGKVRTGARGAVLMKGDVSGVGQLTLAYDSERDPQRTQFRDIDPANDFPIFGDGSLREFDAQTASRLYLRVDRGASFLRFGDFMTPRTDDKRMLLAYDRSLTGLLSHVEGARGVLNSFVSKSRIRQSIDELPGRGLSGPYFLSHTGAVVNSERVDVITRDRNQPSLILQTQPMVRFADYTLEAATGRLLFTGPVASVDANLNPVYIRVSYEVDQGGEDFYTYGADGRLRLLAGLEVGAFAVRDENPIDRQTLLGGSATVALGAGTVALGEFARSETGATAVAGQAWRVELRHQSARLEGRVFAIQGDTAFANQSSTFAGGRNEYGARFSARLTDATRLIGEALRTEDVRTGARRDGALVAFEHRFGTMIVGEFGYRWAQENSAAAASTGLGIIGVGNGLAATGAAGSTNGGGLPSLGFNAALVRLTSKVPGSDRSTLFAEYEAATGNGARRGAVGGDYRIFEHARLYARHEWISSPDGPYTLNAGQDQQNTVFGIDADVRKDAQLFSEYRARDAFSGRDAEASIGLRNRWPIAAGVLANTSFERVSPLAGATTGHVFAATAALELTGSALWKSTARLEWRNSSTGDDLLGSFGYARKLNRDWSMLARTVWDQLNTEQVRGRSVLGLAWRQTDYNGVDALFRIENRVDRTNAQGTPTTLSVANIAALLLNVQPDPRLTFSARYAAKFANDEKDGATTRTVSQLVMGRTIYDVNRWLDLGLIGSVLGDASFGQRAYGVGTEAGFIVVRNLRLALGYNFFGFTDRDFSALGYTQQGPYLEFGFKFDEGLLGIGRDNGGKRP